MVTSFQSSIVTRPCFLFRTPFRIGSFPMDHQSCSLGAAHWRVAVENVPEADDKPNALAAEGQMISNGLVGMACIVGDHSLVYF